VSYNQDTAACTHDKGSELLHAFLPAPVQYMPNPVMVLWSILAMQELHVINTSNKGASKSK